MAIDQKTIVAKLAAMKNKTKDYDEGLLKIEDEKQIIDNTNKFDSLEVATKMMYPAILTLLILRGFIVSAMVFGSAGIGKTYGVMKALSESARVWHKTEDQKANMTPEDLDKLLDQPAPTLVKISGAITPKGLYQLMYKHREGNILVFDDCDDVLRNPKMSNILKAGLDSGVDERVITWETSRPEEGLPTSFEFKSQIIFISNMTADQVDKAVRSRSADINLVLSPDEAYEHIGNLLQFIDTTRLNEKGEPVIIELPEKINKEIFDKISEHRYTLAEYSFRTFKQAVGIYVFCKENPDSLNGLTWFDLWYSQQDEIKQ
jgi:hypothetical protein